MYEKTAVFHVEFARDVALGEMSNAVSSFLKENKYLIKEWKTEIKDNIPKRIII